MKPVVIPYFTPDRGRWACFVPENNSLGFRGAWAVGWTPDQTYKRWEQMSESGRDSKKDEVFL